MSIFIPLSNIHLVKAEGIYQIFEGSNPIQGTKHRNEEFALQDLETFTEFASNKQAFSRAKDSNDPIVRLSVKTWQNHLNRFYKN